MNSDFPGVYPQELYLSVSNSVIKKKKKKVLRRATERRKVDVMLCLAVCATLSLRSFSPTSFFWNLNLTITFGVCVRAVSSTSTVRSLNSAPSVPHHKVLDWQASCGVCIWLAQYPARAFLPPDHWVILPLRCLSHISPHIRRHRKSWVPKLPASCRLQWGAAEQKKSTEVGVSCSSPLSGLRLWCVFLHSNPRGFLPRTRLQITLRCCLTNI